MFGEFTKASKGQPICTDRFVSRRDGRWFELMVELMNELIDYAMSYERRDGRKKIKEMMKKCFYKEYFGVFIRNSQVRPRNRTFPIAH